MKRIRSFRIGQVVGIGFGLVLLVALLIALVGRIAYDISQWQRDIIQRRSDVKSLTLELEILSIKRTETLRRYLESANVSFLAAYQTHQAAYADTYSRLVNLLDTPQETQSLQAVLEAETGLNNKAQEVLRLYNDGFPAAARFLWSSEGTTAQDDLLETIETLRRVQGRTSTTIIDQARQTENLAIIIVSVFIGVVLVGGTAASFLITRSITKPLSYLVKTTTAIGADLTTRVKPSGPKEIAFLGETINDMAVNLFTSRRALQTHKERMERELTLASQIQTSFFSEALPQFPGLEIAAFWQPAQETGGDFYASIELGNGQQGIAVGDVSGKGAPAAMAGALAVGLLEAYAPGYTAPETLLTKLNQELCLRFTTNNPMNVACCYVILDKSSLSLSVANAGCLYPYLRRDNCLCEIAVDGMPLGMWPDFNYTAHTRTLRPGDLLLLSSDGLVEAKDGQGVLFGFDRLEAELLNLPPDVDAQTAIDRLVNVTRTFTAEAELHDDLTLVMIRVVGQ
jgi:serine phosphatase RsbU (regulator of sigma subunit)/CHASE3 domain sensor protein